MILGGRAKSDKGRDTGTHHGFYKLILVVRKKFFRHRLIRAQLQLCRNEMAEGVSEEDQYMPFRGLSAWFSCSVHPEIVKKWGTRKYGRSQCSCDAMIDVCCLQTVMVARTRTSTEQTSCSVTICMPRIRWERVRNRRLWQCSGLAG